MFQRKITPSRVEAILAEGEVIDRYPEDDPYPSYLILGFYQDTPIHVVVAQPPGQSDCFIITVYHPDPEVWDDEFRKRSSQ